MLLTGAGLKIVEVHPPSVNLGRPGPCISSVEQRTQAAVNAGLFRQAIGDAAQLGYNVLRISGREPLLSPDLPVLLRKGRERGMLNTLVTNATSLTRQRLDECAPLLEFLMVDLEGESPVRPCGKAILTRVEEQLSALRNSRVAFGFSLVSSGRDLNDLEAIVEGAVERGAMTIHVSLPHNAGMTNEDFNDILTMLEQRRQKYKSKLHLSTDMMRPSQATEVLNRVVNADLSPRRGRLSRLLSPLVVQSDGRIAPLQGGFPRSFELGDLTKERLLDQATRWLDRKAHQYIQVARSLSSELRTYHNDTFVNLEELMVQSASTAEPALPASWAGVRMFPNGNRVLVA